jgi:serine/threonine protein kinase/N-acetylneuraminic acid mutarotase
MSGKRTCPKCGTVSAGDAMEGLCPHCVALAALSPDGNMVDHDAPDAPPPGTKLRYFGDYELLEEVARGGMGVVFRARQHSLNRTVAVKMVLGGQFASETEVQRFRTEAEAAANLQHPNIVAIYEVGEHAGQHYFSMEYVAGRSLADLVGNGPIDCRRAAGYVKTIAAAIHFAHERGTLHRDLKPTNVLLDSSDRPRITDFGLARRLDAGSGLTVTGQVLGTPSFMPPEQAAAQHAEISTRSDVYSLGAILYFLVTGQPPFTGDTLTETLQKVAVADPRPPRKINPAVPRDLETICLRCLQKNPQQRYESARELAADLERFLRDEPILARPIGWGERLWRFSRRHQLGTGFGVALLLLAATTTLLIRERRLSGAGEPQSSSLPVRSGNGVAGVISGRIYVATPADGHAGLRRFFHRWESASDSWVRLPDSPALLLNSASGVIGGKFLVAGGGDDADGVSDALWVYDPVNSVWSRKAPMPTARQLCAGAVLNDRLYVIGGIAGSNILATMESYDPETDRWREEPPLPTARSALGAAVMNQRLYVVGGSWRTTGGTNLLATVESWQPGQAWQSEPPLLTPVSGAFVTAVGDTIFVAGGKTAFSETTDLQTFGLRQKGWVRLQPVPEARYFGSGAVAFGPKLFLFGGWNDLPGTGNLPHPDVFSYDPSRNSWSRSITPAWSKQR